MSEDPRQKVIDIICEEWPTPDGYLLGFDIYERLSSQSAEVAHYAAGEVLSGLAASNRINLWLAVGDGPPPGGVMIHDIEDELCEWTREPPPIYATSEEVKVSEKSLRPQTENLHADNREQEGPLVSALHHRNPRSRGHRVTFRTVS